MNALYFEERGTCQSASNAYFVLHVGTWYSAWVALLFIVTLLLSANFETLEYQNSISAFF